MLRFILSRPKSLQILRTLKVSGMTEDCCMKTTDGGGVSKASVHSLVCVPQYLVNEDDILTAMW